MFNSNIDAVGNTYPAASAHKNAAGHMSLVKQPEPKLASKEDAATEAQVLAGAVKKLNEHVAPALQTIEFALDQESKRMIVKVVDTATQKVLRQIPNEEVVAMSKTLDKLQGLVIRQTA